MKKPEAESFQPGSTPGTTEADAPSGAKSRSYSPPLPEFRVVVTHGDREVLAYEGTDARITRLTLGEHGRLIHALVLALNVATRHRPEVSDLVEELHAVEGLVEARRPSDAAFALSFIRTVIDDARESFTRDLPPAPLN